MLPPRLELHCTPPPLGSEMTPTSKTMPMPQAPAQQPLSMYPQLTNQCNHCSKCTCSPDPTTSAAYVPVYLSATNYFHREKESRKITVGFTTEDTDNTYYLQTWLMRTPAIFDNTDLS